MRKPILALYGLTALLCAGVIVRAQSSLGTAQSFAVLGGSTVTNTLTPTIVTGDLGVSPGSAVTGFPPGTVVGGTIHAADATAGLAQSDLTTQYNALAGAACKTDLSGQDLGGLTLTTGVYCFSSSAQLTGALTLDAQGKSNATFIFQIKSSLTTASASSVSLINSGNPCGVAWQVGASATLGTGTSFIGNLIALTSITLTSGTNVTGRALARNGAVTLDNNHISFASCGSSAPSVPTLPMWMAIGLAGVLALVGVASLSRRGPLARMPARRDGRRE